jgi:hypothetical protein
LISQKNDPSRTSSTLSDVLQLNLRNRDVRNSVWMADCSAKTWHAQEFSVQFHVLI